MFDAKSLLEALVKGVGPAQPQQAQTAGQAGLGDILGQILGGAQSANAPQAAPSQQGGGLGGLGDILGQVLGGAQAGNKPQAAPGQQSGGLGGGLGDILGQLGGKPGQAGGGLGDILGKLGGAGAQGGGGLADILGQILGQATSGVKEGAQRIDNATGIGGRARDAVTQATGQSPDDLLAKLKDLIAQNQLGAGAAAGGLGAVVLGTQAGRSAALGAAKLGALALIGGLAYKAYLNYSQGKPVIGSASALAEQAPAGSGFEPQAVTNDDAVLYIRAMIAAAAADGRIDPAEQQKIFGAIKNAGGADQAAQEFLQREIQNPATADELAAACRSGEQAVQVFTAARIAVDLNNNEEHDFLVDLATKLGIDGKLAQHIDAAARAQAA